MRYLLGSSYFDGGREFRKDFAHVWHWNTLNAYPKPSRIVIVAQGGSAPPVFGPDTDIINLSGDLGHVGAHLNGAKKHEFEGWSASMCAAAMCAYCDEADFLYKEEDCLAFGPWVNQMYEDMGDGDMVFGRAMTTEPWMPCSQSLFLVRHSFIPSMVREYLMMGGNTVDNLGEHRFCRLEEKFSPARIRRLSFGCERERPIPWDAPVMYCQQWTEAELNEAKRRNLI